MEPEEPRERVWAKRGLPLATAFRFPKLPVPPVARLGAIAIGLTVSGLVAAGVLVFRSPPHIPPPAQAVAPVDTSSPSLEPPPPSSADDVSTTTQDQPPEQPCDVKASKAPSIKPAADPDHASAVFYSDQGALWRYEVARDTSVRIAKASEGCGLWGIHTTDGDHVFFAYPNLEEADLISGHTRDVGPRPRRDEWIATYGLSPDGSMLATLTGGRDLLLSLKILRSDTGTVLASRKIGYVCQCDGGLPIDIKWSKDGNLIAVAYPTKTVDSEVIVIDLNGRTILKRELAANPEWLGGTHRFVYESYTANGQKWIVGDVDSGTDRTLLEMDSLFDPAVSPDGHRVAFTHGDASEIQLVDVATGHRQAFGKDVAAPVWLSNDSIAISKAHHCNCEGSPAYSTTGAGMKLSLETGKQTPIAMTNTTDADALFLEPAPSVVAPPISAPTPTPTVENGVPTFSDVPDQAVTELERVTFEVDAVDPEGGSLTYGASGLPPHATFDPVDHRFTWRPRPGQDGTWVIVFTARDGDGATGKLVVRITVRPLKDSLLGVVPRVELL